MGYKRVTSKELQSKLFELQLRHRNIDTLAAAYGLGYFLISEILGSEWTDSKLSLSGAHHGTFFKSKRLTELEMHQYQGRVMELADTLFVLQDMQGFGSKVTELSKISKRRSEHLEDLVIELHIAKMIFQNNKQTKFITPLKGQRIRTPDLEIPLSGGSIFADIKCRREDMPTEGKWLIKRLAEASSQLKNSPISQAAPTGIFLRVGQTLKGSTNANADGERIANKFFSNNTHVNFIQFVWENWIVNANGSGGYMISFKQFNNPKPLHQISGTDMIIKEISSSSISYDGTYLPYAYLQAIKK